MTYGPIVDLTIPIEQAVKALASDATARNDGSHWSMSAKQELSRASPTSLAVTHEALKRGAECTSLAECLEMEFRMAQRFMRHADFVSGVGAVLGREKVAPVWSNPPSATELEEWFAAGESRDLELTQSS